ncbi:phage tail protein [Gluconobacter japonicus]|nr:phage tail protein [Gluconobacter japonicus]
MNSIGHFYGGDLLLENGGLSVVSGSEEVRQRILRRLLTNSGDYIWQLDYGVGLQGMIGDVVVPSAMQAAIRTQVQKDTGVDPYSPVEVDVSSDPNGVCQCKISYVDADTGQPQTLDFSS